MQQQPITIRAAKRDDAALIATLVNDAGEGMPKHIWSEMASDGQLAFEFGVMRVSDDQAAISYRNTFIAEIDGAIAGCLIAYQQPAIPAQIPPDTPDMYRPFLELEGEAPDTGYVYVLSTLPEMRGCGVGSKLLAFALGRAGPKGNSLIVSDANIGARRLYERFGYRVVGSRTMVKNGWENSGQNWLLMVTNPGANAENRRD